ncbi:hypothetical protein [Paenibacillus sp. FJAT-27812]|uniref:hypothetical protein n=1 Tax=Paenibacillus sp. FJAT-27812 TaxID=1684143 RepID=UPI0006A7CDED|nr:hypothetical protein [Paenibacillus sp. FJAT-27812]
MVSLVLASIDIKLIYILAAAILIAGLFLSLPVLHMFLFETNIARLEKYLSKQRKKSHMYLYYAIANRRDEEIEHLFQHMLSKYKQPQRQALYKVMYDLYHKDAASMKKQLPHIHSEKYRNYYEAFVHLEEGNLELARATAAKAAKPWMRDALLYELEMRAGNRHKAAALARQSLDSCKGIQRYIMYKNYERELPEALTGA